MDKEWTKILGLPGFISRALELLPDEDTDGLMKAVNGKIEALLQRSPWLSRPELSAAQGATLSRDQDRFPRS
jgi:hypothetical protein